jgi:hypothetical protein
LSNNKVAKLVYIKTNGLQLSDQLQQANESDKGDSGHEEEEEEEEKDYIST